jgi:hypothetical protein
MSIAARRAYILVRRGIRSEGVGPDTSSGHSITCSIVRYLDKSQAQGVQIDSEISHRTLRCIT